MHHRSSLVQPPQTPSTMVSILECRKRVRLANTHTSSWYRLLNHPWLLLHALSGNIHTSGAHKYGGNLATTPRDIDNWNVQYGDKIGRQDERTTVGSLDTVLLTRCQYIRSTLGILLYTQIRGSRGQLAYCWNAIDTGLTCYRKGPLFDRCISLR